MNLLKFMSRFHNAHWWNFTTKLVSVVYITQYRHFWLLKDNNSPDWDSGNAFQGCNPSPFSYTRFHKITSLFLIFPICTFPLFPHFAFPLISFVILNSFKKSPSTKKHSPDRSFLSFSHLLPQLTIKRLYFWIIFSNSSKHFLHQHNVRLFFRYGWNIISGFFVTLIPVVCTY